VAELASIYTAIPKTPSEDSPPTCQPRAAKSAAPEEPIEKQLWKAADKLRKNIDAGEYKHDVLGLIFLKYLSDAFEEVHAKLLFSGNTVALTS
jgi:hypothetical protein